mgnify:CR=1 FL=1
MCLFTALCCQTDSDSILMTSFLTNSVKTHGNIQSKFREETARRHASSGTPFRKESALFGHYIQPVENRATVLPLRLELRRTSCVLLTPLAHRKDSYWSIALAPDVPHTAAISQEPVLCRGSRHSTAGQNQDHRNHAQSNRACRLLHARECPIPSSETRPTAS